MSPQTINYNQRGKGKREKKEREKKKANRGESKSSTPGKERNDNCKGYPMTRHHSAATK
jgi:hypothetical protein